MKKHMLIFAVLVCFSMVITIYSAEGQKFESKINQERISWVRKCLDDFNGIKLGMTRGQIEKNFPKDGGLYGASCISFTHPDCPYFKIDVEFDFKRNPNDQNRAIISTDDKVIKVSKPYIEYPHFD